MCVCAARACVCALKFTSYPQRVSTNFVITNTGSLLTVFIWRVCKIGKSFVMSVRPSACNNSLPTGRIFMKLDIRVFFEIKLLKIQVSLKSDKNSR